VLQAPPYKLKSHTDTCCPQLSTADSLSTERPGAATPQKASSQRLIASSSGSAPGASHVWCAGDSLPMSMLSRSSSSPSSAPASASALPGPSPASRADAVMCGRKRSGGGGGGGPGVAAGSLGPGAPKPGGGSVRRLVVLAAVRAPQSPQKRLLQGRRKRVRRQVCLTAHYMCTCCVAWVQESYSPHTHVNYQCSVVMEAKPSDGAAPTRLQASFASRLGRAAG
jgi:hypothetical protein